LLQKEERKGRILEAPGSEEVAAVTTAENISDEVQ
jgi:hypothetical protein